MRRVAPAALAALLLVACGGSEASPTKVGTWQGENGRTLESFAGPEHCDWQSVTFLYSEVDLDEPGATAERQQFLRDPEGALSSEVVVPYDGNAALPDEAVDTGFRLEGVELWAEPADDPAGPDAVYAVEGDSIERWPRTREEVACA